MTSLTAWQNFYVIVGSSAGALIGLQFVVMSFIATLARARANPEAGRAFATPNIVHFSAVLGLSGLLCAPWDGVNTAAMLWGFVGLCGTVYAIIVTRRMRAQHAYQPEFEDWMFHSLLPFLAYLALAASAVAARWHPRESLIAVGAAVLLLLFTAIHNAWDAVTYHVFVKVPESSRAEY